MSYSQQSQFLVPMNDLEQDLFLGVFITKSVCYKVVFSLFFIVLVSVGR